MVKAVLSHGEIRPLEPLPVDWQEGQPLKVGRAIWKTPKWFVESGIMRAKRNSRCGATVARSHKLLT